MARSLDILAIDQNQGDIRLLKEMLMRANMHYTITDCCDGENAIGQIENIANGTQQMPNVVLIEVNLPKHDGIYVLTHARGLLELVNLPMIIFTSSINPADVKQAYRAKANGFILKPFELDEYCGVLDDLYAFCNDGSRNANSIIESERNQLPM